MQRQITDLPPLNPAAVLDATPIDPEYVQFAQGVRCEDLLPALPEAVFDGCVTESPYGIGIADWDREVPGVEVWREVLRVMKLGAWLLAFGACRTYHRLGCTVEDAGFAIVGMASWVYGTGRAPSKQHLKPAHEPILIAVAPGGRRTVNIDAGRIPWRDDEDRAEASRIDTLRVKGSRRRVYAESMSNYGRDAFVTNPNGRWPSTVMATDDGWAKSHTFSWFQKFAMRKRIDARNRPRSFTI